MRQTPRKKGVNGAAAKISREELLPQKCVHVHRCVRGVASAQMMGARDVLVPGRVLGRLFMNVVLPNGHTSLSMQGNTNGAYRLPVMAVCFHHTMGVTRGNVVHRSLVRTPNVTIRYKEIRTRTDAS